MWNPSVLAAALYERCTASQRAALLLSVSKGDSWETVSHQGQRKDILCLTARRHRARKAPTPSPTVQIRSSSCPLEQHPLTFQWNCTELLHEHDFFRLKSAISWLNRKKRNDITQTEFFWILVFFFFFFFPFLCICCGLVAAKHLVKALLWSVLITEAASKACARPPMLRCQTFLQIER